MNGGTGSFSDFNQSGLVTLTFHLLALKVVPESRTVWRGLPLCNFSLSKPLCSVLELGPKYATDRQTDVRKTDVRQTSDVRQHRLMPHLLRART